MQNMGGDGGRQCWSVDWAQAWQFQINAFEEARKSNKFYYVQVSHLESIKCQKWGREAGAGNADRAQS